MEPFVTHRGRVALLDWTDVNTDLIIPARYLKKIERTGFGPLLFADKRYAAGGAPLAENPDHHGPEVAEFPLNHPAVKGATVLVVGHNFGCGSSREHAVWGLVQYGFAAVVAPSFAEIFYNNAFNNRLLLVELKRAEVDELVRDAQTNPQSRLHIDIERQTVTSGSGRVFKFPIAARHKRMVIESIDMIALTLASLDGIESFEREHRRRNPWAIVG